MLQCVSFTSEIKQMLFCSKKEVRQKQGMYYWPLQVSVGYEVKLIGLSSGLRGQQWWQAQLWCCEICL